MSKPEVISIDGVDYVRKGAETALQGDIKIVILDRGFIYVGAVKYEGDFIVITNAKNLRYWGTTKGLGELVNGPLPNTKLDLTGTLRAPLRALIAVIDVNQDKWK